MIEAFNIDLRRNASEDKVIRIKYKEAEYIADNGIFMKIHKTLKAPTELGNPCFGEYSLVSTKPK